MEPVLSLTDIAVVGNIGYDSFSESNENITAVAAVGLAGSLLSSIIWIFAQIKSAISALVSQAYGSSNMGKMATLIPQMIYFNLSVGIVTMIAAYFSSAWIFENILSAQGGILKDSVSYFNIRVWGLPLTLVTFSLFGVFRGVQNTWWMMIVALTGGLLNVFLDFVFVLGWLNWTEPMGVDGAAIASVIAQALMFILALYFLFFHAKIQLKHSWKLNDQFIPLLQIAGNLVLRTTVLNLVLMLTHKFANVYGTIEAATHAVMLNLWLFSAFFLDGFASSANAQAGKFLGAKNKDAMKRNLSRHLGLSILTAFVLITLLVLFHKPLMGLLIDNDEVWGMYPRVLYLFEICLLLNALAFALDGIYKGMGKAKFLRNLLFISTLIGFLPVLLIGHWIAPRLETIWWAIMAWMFFRAIIPYFHFKKWLREF